MDIFAKNMTALEACYNLLPQRLKKLDINKIAARIGVKETPLGNQILVVNKDGRLWNLNSRLDPETVSAIYAETCEIKKFGVYFVFGCSDGRHIREIMKKCDDTNRVIVCIPDIELFYAACCQFDLTDLIENKRLLFYAPEENDNFEDVLKEVIDYTNSKLVDFFILPGQDVLYHEVCEAFIEQVIEEMRNIMVTKSTREAFNRKVPQNNLSNMKHMIGQSNHEQLRCKLQEAGATDLPAIIVSAGPSLDKNIHELKKAQGKAFIIVVDAALRSVIRAGIRPDMVCTVDPNVPNRFYEAVDLSDIIWSCTAGTKPEVIQKYGKKIFYYGYFCKYWSTELKRELGYDFPDVKSGGSVSIEAFMLCCYLGFKKIVLIGQDLAFTGGVSHTKGVGDALGDNDEYIKSRYLMQVEGIDGSILDTDFQMWYYKQWFEKFIKSYAGQVEVIDATEGGALIQGTVLRTLEETIRDECSKEVDIYQLELEIPPTFSTDQQEKMLEKLKAMKGLVEQFKEQVETGLDNQRKTLRLAKSKNANSSMVGQQLKWILQQSEAVKRELIMDMVLPYASAEEYQFGDNIYAEEEMSVKDLIQQSINLYEGYQKASEVLLEDIENLIMND